MPDRRHFLAATAGSLLCPDLSYAGPLSGKIKIGVKYHMIIEPKLTVAEKFTMLKEVGLEGSEIKTDEKIDHTEVEKAIESTGVPVHGIVNAGKPEIIPAIEMARRFNCESVLIFAAEDPKISYDKNFALWQERVRTALPMAEKHGVHLCVENVRATFLKTAEGMARFLDSFDSPFIHSYFDLGNTITWTEQPAEHWAKILGKRIYKLDIKDRGHPEFGEAKLKREGAVGTDGGEVHWERVRKHLVDNSFSGWATAEVKGGDRKRLAGIAGWMRDVLDIDTA